MNIKIEQKVLSQIGSKLRELRIKKGFKSHEDFAIKYKLSRVQVWKIEAAKANITMSTLLRMLEIHKISLKDFFKDIEG
ncbi:MAG TPA: helix-turn-helix transcriptional regulator [Bacteroidia bacterium]|nr:helix-turn-helix transcriptional regulator [Bacteroidia bacterium]